MASKIPFEQLKSWDVARLVGDPIAQEAFFTPEGGLDLADQDRLRRAREIAVQMQQGNYQTKFQKFWGDSLPDWTRNEWVEVDPVKGYVKLKDAMREAIAKAGTDPLEIERKLSRKLGAYKGSGTFVQDLAKVDDPTADPSKLDEAKRSLFNEVAKSLAGAATDEEKAAIFREAFGRAGPEASQRLLDEFGNWADLSYSEAVKKEQDRLKDQPVRGGVLGQLLEALDAPSDLAQNLIGVVRGKRDLGDVGDSLVNLVKGVGATATLGMSSKVPDVLDALGLEGASNTARDALLDQKGEVSFGDIVPEIHKLPPGVGHAAGFAGELLTDPLTYVSLGAGSLGKQGARELVGSAVERLVAEGGEQAAGKGAAAAVKAALGNRINFTQALKTFDNLGYNPAALAEEFPRIGLGRTGAAATQARGGLTLRAGVPGTNLKAAVNVAPGGSKLDLLIRPRLISNVLDSAGAVGEVIRNPFGLADKLSRHGLTASFRRANPVFANAWEGIHREAKGLEHRSVNQAVGSFRQARVEMARIAKRARMSDDELRAAANNIIELGTDSPHYDGLVARVGQADADLFVEHASKISQALEGLRQAAIAVGADVPELADQAAGKIGYLPHRLADSDLDIALAKARLPGRLGATKTRELKVGGAITNPISGEVLPVPQGTLEQINAATEQMYGRAILNADPFQVAEIYAYGLGKVIRNNHVVNRLAEEGLGTELGGDLAGDLASHYRSVVTKPEEIKRIYTLPLEVARTTAVAAFVGQEAGQRQLAAAARSLAALQPEITHAVGEVERLRELTAVRSEVAGMLAREAADKEQLAVAAKRLFDHEREIFSTARDAEIQDLVAAGALPGRIKATSAKWKAFERSALQDLQRVQNLLKTAPAGLRSRAEQHLKGLRPEAAAALRGASGRPYAAILADAVDTQKTIQLLRSVERYGKDSAFKVMQEAAQASPEAALLNRAVALSDRMAELQTRRANEIKAGRYARAAEIEDEYLQLLPKFEELQVRVVDNPLYQEQMAQALRAMKDPELADKLAGFAGDTAGLDELVARHQEGKLIGYVDNADLIEQQRLAAEAGDQRTAARLAEEIAGSNELMQRTEGARKYVDAQRAIRALAERSLHPDDAANRALVEGLQQHLDDTLRELEETAKGGVALQHPTRAIQALQARYLEEQSAVASVFTDDWRLAQDRAAQELAASQTLQKQVKLKQTQLRQLVRDRQLSALEYQQATEALENLTAANADALTKLLATPAVVEQMVPHLSQLALVIDKIPYANRTLALPEDLAAAIRSASTPRVHNTFLRNLTRVTNAWKRGTLSIPGSTGRRMIGELINASYYGGMTPGDLQQGMDVAKAVRRARGQVDALPSQLRELGQAMIDQNIFEGKLVDIYAHAGLESQGLFGNKVKPIRRYEDFMLEKTASMEDTLRAALFIHARGLGMSDVGARSYVGKYLFFHDELSELEQGALRSLIPFWTYLRNNTQLQLEMLYAKPGRPAAYNSLLETAAAEQEATFGPENVYDQGGFALPLHGPAGQEVFYPGLFDQPQGLGFIGQTVGNLLDAVQGGIGGTGEGLSFQELNPALSTLYALLSNKNLYTGAEYGSKTEPYGPFGAELAQLTPRNRQIIESLIPQVRQAGQLTAASPSRQEAQIENLLSVLVGPTVRPNSERSQAGAANSIAHLLEDLNAGNPTKVGDVQRGARDLRDLEALAEALRRLGLAG
jgi:hypothetical protein